MCKVWCSNIVDFYMDDFIFTIFIFMKDGKILIAMVAK